MTPSPAWTLAAPLHMHVNMVNMLYGTKPRTNFLSILVCTAMILNSSTVLHPHYIFHGYRTLHFVFDLAPDSAPLQVILSVRQRRRRTHTQQQTAHMYNLTCQILYHHSVISPFRFVVGFVLLVYFCQPCDCSSCGYQCHISR